jgi:hypothetical protein
MSLWYARIYTPKALKIQRPRLSVIVAILAKASEGPQKQDLTVFLEV